MGKWGEIRENLKNMGKCRKIWENVEKQPFFWAATPDGGNTAHAATAGLGLIATRQWESKSYSHICMPMLLLIFDKGHNRK